MLSTKSSQQLTLIILNGHGVVVSRGRFPVLLPCLIDTRDVGDQSSSSAKFLR